MQNKKTKSNIKAIFPGLILSFSIAGAAIFSSQFTVIPVMVIALILGMFFYRLSDSHNFEAGVNFTANNLLKIGVAFLGVKITFEQIGSLGVTPLIIIPIFILFTFAVGLLLARIFKRTWSFGVLSAGAVAICGSAAALAIAAVLPKEKLFEKDVLFTVVAVTGLSTIAMIAYPVIFQALGFSETEIGILIGASIHNVAQTVGAGYSVSDKVGDIATYVKLLRVSLLPVVIIILALIVNKDKGISATVKNFPLFAVGFIALLVINSLGLIPELVQNIAVTLSHWFLVAAIAALGIKTSIKAMVEVGPGHLMIIVSETIFLLVFAGLTITILN